jgi:hypothetical protein
MQFGIEGEAKRAQIFAQYIHTVMARTREELATNFRKRIDASDWNMNRLSNPTSKRQLLSTMLCNGAHYLHCHCCTYLDNEAKRHVSDDLARNEHQPVLCHKQ